MAQGQDDCKENKHHRNKLHVILLVMYDDNGGGKSDNNVKMMLTKIVIHWTSSLGHAIKGTQTFVPEKRSYNVCILKRHPC